MALKRFNRVLSPTKPANMKPGTWALIQGAHVRRQSQLSGKGNNKKAKSIAKHLWATKEAANSFRPRIAYDASKHTTAKPKAALPTLKKSKSKTHPAKKYARIRFGAPLRNVPGRFKTGSFEGH